MASPGSWAEFETQRDNIRHNTVAKLQTIISGWTDQCRVSIPKSGKKQDLIDRMTRAMTEWKENNQLDKWLRAKAVLDQVRETGQYNHYAMPPELTGGFTQLQSFTTNSPTKPNGNVPYLPPAGAGPSHFRYDAYAPPRKAAPSVPSSSSPPVKPSIRFKSSPFFRVEQPVSPVVECPESTSAMDRRSQGLNFTLTSEQIAKLQPSGSKHQLRLFCTSSVYHAHHSTGFRTEPPCPIEFPATCEVRVNNTQLSANLKGLKKKPGTAPPPDLGKAVRLTPAMPNRVDMVYVNSQQPVLHKKYFMVVYLVEVTTVEQLVDKLKKGKYRSESDIRAKMAQTANFDDDIIAGPQKMSLKCPLSYMRVNTPCRSIQCPHAQCFDATSWFSMMEQTTTWLCPVCDKVLNVEELIVDGYFDRILKDTPETVEDVMVEADGEWHTSDNKFASAGWRASHPISSAEPDKSPSPKDDPDKHIQSSSSQLKETDGRAPQEVISLTDSEDDEGIVKRELSPTSGYTPSQSQSFDSSRNVSGRLPPLPQSKSKSSSEVIDLTVDSDDDDNPPPPPPPSLPPPPLPPPTLVHKRKEREQEPDLLPSWKKQRYPGPSGSGSYGSYPNGIACQGSSNVNGPNHSPYMSTASGSNGWGSVRLPPPPPPPPQTPYQAPHPHVTSLSSGMPVHPPNMNGPYPNYPPGVARSMNMPMSQSQSLPPLYYSNQYRHQPGHN